ncbi:hypothetical protein ACTI_69090 [Actinoplanes sp. OR16]|nr:hypothetical protein ACTI_69090 [Actinoplanes sp. OR16]
MTAIAGLLSVLAVAVGVFVTSHHSREQQKLALQGQITDRFTKAVEQLGQPGVAKVDVRLGAIYALQRIMRDSDDDQAAVVDILSAFVRGHAPAPRRTEQVTAGGVPTARPVDVQAALTVLARRDSGLDGEGRVDLSEADLSLAALRGAKLHRAEMLYANLRNANLRNADLRGADLSRATLRGANLHDGALDGADLGGANLRDVELGGAKLVGANLRGASLQGTRLAEADLRGAVLHGADLHGALLEGADLSGALLDPDQLWCAHLDERTVLPEELVRPSPSASDLDSQCRIQE